MTNREAASHRVSSSTATSNSDSTRSSVTVKPYPTPAPSAVPGATNPAPYGVDAGLEANRLSPHQNSVSSTTGRNQQQQQQQQQQQTQPQAHFFGITNRDRRSRDLLSHRRDLASIETSRLPDIEQEPPTAGTTPLANQIAPWVTDEPPPQLPPAKTGGGSFYNDFNEGHFISSQPSALSLGSLSRNSYGFQDPLEPPYFNDARRPSVASVATASSTGSKTSMSRAGGLRKLQGFFGEDFPGREGSDSTGSLPASVAGKDQHGRSYSHSRPSHRDRKASNATSIDQTRDASPSSRPRTPVPAPEVVPFLYQDNSDIARYGEAPVRTSLTGPDRERYVPDNASHNPPKTSSSARSGHSIVHMPGHHHRHNRSNDDPRSLRPSMSREDSVTSMHMQPSSHKGSQGTIQSVRPRAQSPTPSANSGPPQSMSRSGSGQHDGQASPGNHGKLGILGRFRRHKDKEEPSGTASRLRSLPHSAKSLQVKGSKTDLGRRDQSPARAPTSQSLDFDGPEQPRNAPRGATFNNKFPFSKKARMQRPQEYVEEEVGPTELADPSMKNVWHLDTNLNDMEGVLAGPLPLMASPIPKGHWDAPDSWAVRRNTEDNTYEVPEIDNLPSPPRADEKMTPYCIRIFRSDGTFSTHQMPLDATVTDVISQVIKKAYVVDGLDNYHIILKRQGLVRVLSPVERPLLIQKRMLEQVGYEEKDRIEELGREDNTYLCRFMFLSAKESDFHSKTADMTISRTQKQNYVDLSGRNLITIPISLYSRASDIISLNLSRNLSLDVPRDFIQSCKHLREIKFNNNEARRLPPSLCRASKLTYLDVSNNKVEQLEHADLNSLNGLLMMNLANNRLKHLPSYFGAYLSLRSLNISSNFLEKFPQFLCNLPSLVDLDLSFNAISSLPEEIGNLKSLEKLLITNNRLSQRVPDTFRDLSSLRELDIKYNGITSIDIISYLPKLEILYADHNAISAFTGTFERLRQLKLNSNPLNRFEIEEPLPTLKTLNLSSAQLASIDSTFPHVFNLEHLILDDNYFVSLPPQIGTLLKLEHFSIVHNSVGELPPQIGCLTELRVLNVRGNNISKLPMEIWWARKLETFNASSNLLDHFPKPASRAPRVPGEEQSGAPPLSNGKGHPLGTPPATESIEELPEERRPSQASSTLLSVGPSPVSDRKSSIVSLYGKGGRKTSVVSRTTSQGTVATNTPHTTTTTRKDSGLSSKLTNTFAGSLRNLYLADNRLDDDVFDQITLCAELRVLNLSYNDEIGDMPQQSIKSWPQLVELYLSGNGLTTLPADDLEDASLLQALYINGNKFTNLPADISRAKKLAVLDCGSNSLKYNIANVPYDWNWNLNPNLRYLNLSGNKKLEIKKAAGSSQQRPGSSNADLEQYTDFSRLQNLRVLGLMDVTLKQPSIPDQSEDRRVRTSGSLAGHLPYGMADTLGKNEHLSTVDLVVPRFNSSETEMLLGLFDGQALSSGGSKIAKYLHENFGHVFAQELNSLKIRHNETPSDALRRAFLAVNKDLATVATNHATDERPRAAHKSTSQPLVLSTEDLNSGGVATVVYLQGLELYVANVGDAQAMIIQTDGTHKILTQKHDPAEPMERSRIREAGGWVSRNGRLNDTLEVSRAFGYCDLMPIAQSAPHVSHMTIGEQNDIILLATKELWDYLSPGLVTDVARAERADPMRAAQKLRDYAMAYGATGKIMVMMISVADLKRRVERSKLNRGASMSLYPSGVPEEAQGVPRRLRKTNRDVLDSSLSRLEAEIPPPTGNVSIVFTDIKNSTTLWELYPNAMRSAIKLHNEVMRRQLRRIGGYEVKTEGDAFMVSFPTAISALLWCFAVQLSLLEVQWPSEVLNAVSAQLITDKDDTVIFKGLSVRMGIHYGDCVSEVDPVTHRMDYFGPMVNKASRISAVADGGQIAVSYDFITEIQRCLENYQDTDRNASNASDDTFEEEAFANSIRKDLRSLTSQGFAVKEMGEKKLKGLENPELVYSLYPQALAGRIDYHSQLERPEEVTALVDEQPATLRPGAAIDFTPDMIWDLWKVSLRLEMLCSTLEEVRGPGLQPPETQLMERIKARGGEVTERFLLNFMEHQVSRIETCVSTLTMRHLAIGGGTLRELNQLRAPMSQIFDVFDQQRRELERYKARFGPLPDEDEDVGNGLQVNGFGSSDAIPTPRKLTSP